MALRLRSTEGVSLGALFVYASGLYFRGKLAYATYFAAPPIAKNTATGTGVHIITPNAGLLSPDAIVRTDDVRAFAQTSIDLANDEYRRPLEQTARQLRTELLDAQVVLLGSIASPKYVDVLLEIFGERLCFPVAFVGRGDMSRGGLLLRQVAAGEELEYAPIAGAVRHGARPPKLPPRGPATGEHYDDVVKRSPKGGGDRS